MITFLFFFVIICRFKVLIELHLYLKTIIKLQNLLIFIRSQKTVIYKCKKCYFWRDFLLFFVLLKIRIEIENNLEKQNKLQKKFF